MSLKPIQKQSVSDAVFEQLKAAILTGEFEAGSELQSERALAETLRVNRGAIREALKRLDQARLVSIHQGGPTLVLDFRSSARLDLVSQLVYRPDGKLDLKVARSMVELRAVITPDIARLAALRGGPELGVGLKACVEEMRAADGDVNLLQPLGNQFWRIAVDACDNVAYRLLYNTIEDVHVHYSEMIRPILAERYRDLTTWQAMADAIDRGDSEAARQAAVHHSEGMAGNLHKSIKSQRS